MTDVPIGNTYDKYASSNPIERRLMQGFFEALDASLPDGRPSRILEVGVGEGEVATRVKQRWAGVPYVGIDLPDDAARASLARRWPRRRVRRHRRPAVPRRLVRPRARDRGARARDGPGVGARASWRGSPPAHSCCPYPASRCGAWRTSLVASTSATSATPPGTSTTGRRASFAGLVSHHFAVDGVRRPFPWTMVSARLSG